MTTLERAARAAEFADEAFVAQYPGEAFVARACPNWSKAIARAVLEAIRDPSDGMIDGGKLVAVAWKRVGDGGHIQPINAAANVWQAMIDAALKEG